MSLRIPYSWLKTYLPNLPPPEQLAERLTIAGLEVETIEKIGADWQPEKLIVGEIVSVSQHPAADRLCLAEVKWGANQKLTVVTGAANIMALITPHNTHTPNTTTPHSQSTQGLGKVPLALAGALLVDISADIATDNKPKKQLKPSRIRGILSEGMLCSEKELGLSNDHQGILMLPPESEVGQPLVTAYGETVLVFDIKGGFGHLLGVRGIAREVKALMTAGIATEQNTAQNTAQNTTENKVANKVENKVANKVEITTENTTANKVASTFFSSSSPSTSFVDIHISDPQLCPRYSAVLIEGIKMTASPAWLQKRLQDAGMRSVNAVVDATNYVMLAQGQPLHAFDFNLLSKQQNKAKLIIRRAEPQESMKTLDGQSRVFDDRMLLIAEPDRPLAIAGIMGGSETEIQPTTTDVLLEVANFDFLNIRRTSQLLKIDSEAATRFSKRLDAAQTLDVALECAQLIVKHCGGRINPQAADIYPAPLQPTSIELSLDWLANFLGKRISPQEITHTLTTLGFQVTDSHPSPVSSSVSSSVSSAHSRSNSRSNSLCVTPPSFRQDVSMPADLAEEIARIHGYQNFSPTRIACPIPLPRDNTSFRCQERIRDILVNCGVNEIITYSLSSPQDEQRLRQHSVPAEESKLESSPAESSESESSKLESRPAESRPASPLLCLKNPQTPERSQLRQTLLPSMLKTVADNFRFLSSVAVFELGVVFGVPPSQSPPTSPLVPSESLQLAVALGGLRSQPHWQKTSPAKLDFYDIKGLAETLLAALHIENISFKTTSSQAELHPGRQAEIWAGNQLLGQLGELHPASALAFQLEKYPLNLLNLKAETLIKLWQEGHQAKPISSHPPIYQDLAFVADIKLPAEEIRQQIFQSGGTLLKEVLLFDCWQSDALPAGKKSLAYALTYQSPERTLSDKEITRIRKKIIHSLQQMGVVLR